MPRASSKPFTTDRVDCGECGKPCGLVDGSLVYPSRPDLAAKVYWRCAGCGAYCGCHEGTTKPLGTPAGPETRKARAAAHAAFDVLWARKARRDNITPGEARGAAYRWLAEQLQIDPKACHIAMLDAATATRVAQLCLPYSQPEGARA